MAVPKKDLLREVEAQRAASESSRPPAQEPSAASAGSRRPPSPDGARQPPAGSRPPLQRRRSPPAGARPPPQAGHPQRETVRPLKGIYDEPVAGRPRSPGAARRTKAAAARGSSRFPEVWRVVEVEEEPDPPQDQPQVRHRLRRPLRRPPRGALVTSGASVMSVSPITEPPQPMDAADPPDAG